VVLDLHDPDAAAAQIERFAGACTAGSAAARTAGGRPERTGSTIAPRPIAAIIPTDDESAVVAAAASARLGLPHNPVAAVRAARRKDELRRVLQAAGVRTPRHVLLDATLDPAAAAERYEALVSDRPTAPPASRRPYGPAHPTRPARPIGPAAPYPCVLKPTFLAASRGVIRADDRAGFAAAFRRIAALLSQPDVVAKGRDAGEGAGRILVEEYVPGAEVALEGLLIAGRLNVLAIFDKPDPLEGPFFEETIYVTPSRLPRPALRAVVATAAAGARALGLREGPVHAELRVAGAAAWLLEMAARSIGGLCSRTLRFGTGRSLEEVLLLHALDAGRHASSTSGKEARAVRGAAPVSRGGARPAGLTPLRREPRPAGVMMIPIPRAGILEEVRGLEAARRVPGITEISITATRGREIVPLPEGSAYLGFIFAGGRLATPAAVEAALRRAHDLLELHIA
jgi:biotin carboxylase